MTCSSFAVKQFALRRPFYWDRHQRQSVSACSALSGKAELGSPTIVFIDDISVTHNVPEPSLVVALGLAWSSGHCSPTLVRSFGANLFHSGRSLAAVPFISGPLHFFPKSTSSSLTRREGLYWRVAVVPAHRIRLARAESAISAEDIGSCRVSSDLLVGSLHDGGDLLRRGAVAAHSENEAGGRAVSLPGLPVRLLRMQRPAGATAAAIPTSRSSRGRGGIA